MNARKLRRILKRAMAVASPVATCATLVYITSGCCPDYVTSEVRQIAAVPDGWSRVGTYFTDGENSYYGSPEDPGIDAAACESLCGGTVDGCELVVVCQPPAGEGGGGTGGEDGGPFGCDPEGIDNPYAFLVLCDATYGASCGRRPAYMRGSRAQGSAPIGAYFARLAELEAASVDAFAILGAELKAHGAPLALRRAATCARRDEQRHARVMTALARRFGGVISPRRAPGRSQPRSLREIAIENVREGCVRETFGAASALWQADHAQDPRVRAALRRIAGDEIRHGALAWRVASWAESRLSAADRGAVRRAASEARRTLDEELALEPPPELVRIAGVPPAAVARRMLGGMAELLPDHCS